MFFIKCLDIQWQKENQLWSLKDSTILMLHRNSWDTGKGICHVKVEGENGYGMSTKEAVYNNYVLSTNQFNFR